MSKNHQEAGIAREAFKGYCDFVSVHPCTTWPDEQGTASDLRVKTRKAQRGRCSRLWTYAGILWDGSVVPCCRDYDGTAVLGNVSRQSMSEIFNSDKTWAFRRNHHTHPLCRTCENIGIEFTLQNLYWEHIRPWWTRLRGHR